MRILTAFLAIAAFMMASPAQAAVKVGEKAPAFNKLPGTVGGEKDVTLSLGDFKGKTTVLVITCNHCPVAVRYEDKIIKLAEKYKDNKKVAVVAINVNRLDIDKLPAMKKRAKAKGFQFPYLFDESQKIARALGASVTPEFYVISPKGMLIYHGAMDERGKGKNFVDAAVQASLAGKKPEVQETRPFGCGVVYEDD